MVLCGMTKSNSRSIDELCARDMQIDMYDNDQERERATVTCLTFKSSKLLILPHLGFSEAVSREFFLV